jgi:hypothetical protein
LTQGAGKVSISLQPIQGQQQSMSKTCIENSCQTIICTDDQPCHSIRSDSDLAANEQPLEDTTTGMQSTEEKGMADTFLEDWD